MKSEGDYEVETKVVVFWGPTSYFSNSYPQHRLRTDPCKTSFAIIELTIQIPGDRTHLVFEESTKFVSISNWSPQVRSAEGQRQVSHH